MDKIIEYLKQLELSDIEAKLYLTLLKTGPLSVRDLAETVEIKRTTAYLYIDLLIEKGLIMKMVKGANKLVAANEPEETLHALVKKKLQQARNLEATFPSMLTSIHTSLPEIKDVGEAEIKYYKGKNGVSKIYEEALKSDELRLYVNLAELEKILFPNDFGMDYNMFERALERNKKLNIFEIIVNPLKTVEQFNLEKTVQQGRYQYKYTSDIRLASPGILMYDKKVAIISSKGKLSSIVLDNQDYYDNSKDLFDFIWKTLA